MLVLILCGYSYLFQEYDVFVRFLRRQNEILICDGLAQEGTICGLQRDGRSEEGSEEKRKRQTTLHRRGVQRMYETS
jgi:hypothetical protein